MTKFNILIVDDIEENLHSLRLLIEDNFDVNIFTSLSAQKGMSILMKNDIHLILSDIQMPDIDGFEFAEYLKGIERTKNIPLIFITGIYDKDNYQKKGYELGAIEYITKPIDNVLLNAKLKIYIDLFDKQRKKDEEINSKDEILIHQAKMATMGEMIGVIAHQMKQPLNVLSLYCDDVKDSYEYNEIDENFIDEYYKNTKEQIKFLSETIDGFREFFNPDKNKTLFTVNEAVNKSIKLIEKDFLIHSISIINNTGDEKVYGVMTELEQVILNLLANSRDAFMDKSLEDRQININVSSSKEFTTLTFEDNAGGIKKEHLEKIFDPYFTTKKEGTGTGLYMVKLVIKTSFSGNLKIENSSNGLKFIIDLLNHE